MKTHPTLLLWIAGAALVSSCADGTEPNRETKVVFSPSTGRIPVPNDLLFAGSQDATLNFTVADPADLADPSVALNSLDGWSTTAPLQITFTHAIDLSTAVAGDGIRMFEVTVDTTTSPVGGPVTSLGQEFLDYEVGLVEYEGDGDEMVIEVRPTQPLSANQPYLVLVTESIEDEEGTPIWRDTEFGVFALEGNAFDPMNDASAFAVDGLVDAMLGAAAAEGIERTSVACAYTFTTQSIGLGAGTAAAIALGQEAIIVGGLQAAADAGLSPVDPADQGWVASEVPLASWSLADNGFVDTGLDTPGGAARLFTGSMDVPYYSDPEGPLGPNNDGTDVDGEGNPIAYQEQPWSSRFDWPNFEFDDQGNVVVDEFGDPIIVFTNNLTQFNPLPQYRSTERIPVLVSVPLAVYDDVADALTVESLPVTYVQHGIGSDRTALLGIADALAAEGRVGVSIDLPMHGVEDLANPYFTDNDPATGSGVLKERLLGITSEQSTTAFINLASLQIALANTQQAIADVTALRLVGPTFDFDGDGDADVDGADTSFIGLSLGGIVGTTALAIHAGAGVPALPTTLAMPGSGIPYLLQGSTEFGPFVDGLLLALGVEAGTPDYDRFFWAAQTVVDGIDPINFSAALGASDYPIHLIEVVGNGDDNPADTVVPNSVMGAPLAGTDPMIAAMGLQQHSSGTLTTDPSGGPVKAFVAFTEGNHASLVSPGDPGAPNADDNQAAFTEMQSQTIGFVANGGTELTITDESVVQ